MSVYDRDELEEIGRGKSIDGCVEESGEFVVEERERFGNKQTLNSF